MGFKKFPSLYVYIVTREETPLQILLKTIREQAVLDTARKVNPGF